MYTKCRSAGPEYNLGVATSISTRLIIHNWCIT